MKHQRMFFLIRAGRSSLREQETLSSVVQKENDSLPEWLKHKLKAQEIHSEIQTRFACSMNHICGLIDRATQPRGDKDWGGDDEEEMNILQHPSAEAHTQRCESCCSRQDFMEPLVFLNSKTAAVESSWRSGSTVGAIRVFAWSKEKVYLAQRQESMCSHH